MSRKLNETLAGTSCNSSPPPRTRRRVPPTTWRIEKPAGGVETPEELLAARFPYGAVPILAPTPRSFYDRGFDASLVKIHMPLEHGVSLCYINGEEVGMPYPDPPLNPPT